MNSKIIAVLAVPLAIAGCQHDMPGAQPNGYPYLGGPDNFGEAHLVTMAAQVVDPDPVYDTAMADSSAEHAAQAAERYRTDKVKKPDTVRTSTLSAGGGGN